MSEDDTPLAASGGGGEPRTSGGEAATPGEGSSTLGRLLARQRREWLGGEPVLVEDLLAAAPELSQDAEAVLDLIYGEARLRSGRGEAEPFALLAGRFPALAGAIGDLEAVHAAVAAGPGPPPRTLLGGKYRVLAELGRGAQGVVYHALDTVLLREVAVKRLPGEAFPQAEDAARLLQEARALASLEHPHIVRIHEAAAGDGSVEIVLELIRGRDLGRWMRDASPLPPLWVVEVVRQAALALAHLHAQGMVHRDVKPSNILVEAADPGSPPIAKLSDFGLVRRGKGRDRGAQPAAEAFAGTLGYAAPEMMDDSHRPGPEADVYSLGRVLLEALTGSPAGDGQLAAEADPRLTRILRGMLRPEPRRRLKAEHVERALAILGAGPRARDRRAGGDESAIWSEASGARAPARPLEPGPAGLETLDARERGFLARLAVFPGSFTLDAAEELLADLAPAPDACGAVARLLERGVLQRAPGARSARLALHPVVREEARRRVAVDGSWTDSRRCHLRRSFELAFRVGEGLAGRDQARWMRQLADELPDLEAALSYALEAPDLEAGLAMAVRLSRAYALGGRGREARAWILRFLRRGRRELAGASRKRACLALSCLALAARRWGAARSACERLLRSRNELAPDPSFLAAVLINRATAARHLPRLQDPSDAAAVCREAVDLCRDSRLPALEASALQTLGLIAFDRGDLEEAGDAFARAHALLRDCGDADACVRALLNRARVTAARGLHELAMLQTAEALDLAREAGLRQAEAWGLNNLGALESELRDSGEAKERLETALVLFNMAADAGGAAVAWNNLGWADWLEGNLEDARASFAASREKLADAGEIPGTALLLNEARLEIAERRLDLAASRIEEALARLRRLPDRLALLGAVDVLCELEIARGRAEAASKLAGTADAARAALGMPRPARLETRLTALLAGARAALADDDAWRRARNEGLALGLEDVGPVREARKPAGA